MVCRRVGDWLNGRGGAWKTTPVTRPREWCGMLLVTRPAPPGSCWTWRIAAAGIGTFDWDLITGTLSRDARLIALFGYDTATFDRTIEGFNARVHPDDLERVGALLQGAIDTVGEFAAEYRVLLPPATNGGWPPAGGRWPTSKGPPSACSGRPGTSRPAARLRTV